MRQDTALVIVDVQPEFIPKGHPSLDHVIFLFQRALQDRIPIITLEYLDCGRTIPQLRTKNRLCVTYTKNGDDGSSQVMEACGKLKIRPTNLIFCGYNYDACIFETIEGLRYEQDFRGKITVVQEATNFFWGTEEGKDPAQLRRRGKFIMDYDRDLKVSHHRLWKSSKFQSKCCCVECWGSE